jgi:hypothetical protein
MQNAECKMQNENYLFRQPVLGGGTKTDAGANVAVTRTEVKKYCPKRTLGAEQLKN